MYGYKWIEADGRYVVGSELPGGQLLRQCSEMQPVGHWVRGDEREFRDCGMYRWEPGPIERFKRWRAGWSWHAYSAPKREMKNLDEVK
jgi:hypothetical protein